MYGHAGTEVRLQSETADNIIWARYTNPRPVVGRNDSSSSSSSKSPVPSQQEVLLTPSAPRVTFKEITSAKPLHVALDEAYALQQSSANVKRKCKSRRTPSSAAAAGVGIVVVTGRSRRLATESHRAELKELMLEDSTAAGGGSGHGEASERGMVREVRKTVGEVGSAFVGRGVGVGVWVLQAALDGEM